MLEKAEPHGWVKNENLTQICSVHFPLFSLQLPASRQLTSISYWLEKGLSVQLLLGLQLGLYFVHARKRAQKY
jgi:hypothetical protein